MELKRTLGAGTAAWIVAGSMIGAGIFFMPGLVAAEVPSAGVALVAWALGGVLALAGAAVYGELGARIPRAGGDYRYLTEAFGPFWGFLNGWAAITLTFSAAAAAQARSALAFLIHAVPGGEAIAPLTAPLACGVVLLLTWTNVTGLRVSGRATAWLTGVPVAGLVALFVGALFVEGRRPPPPPPPPPPRPAPPPPCPRTSRAPARSACSPPRWCRSSSPTPAGTPRPTWPGR